MAGFGLVMSFFEVAGFQFVDIPVASNATVTDTYTIPVRDMVTNLSGSDIVSVQEDSTLPESTMRVEIAYNDTFFQAPVVYQETNSYLSGSLEEEMQRQWEDRLEKYNQDYAEYEAAIDAYYEADSQEDRELPVPPEYPDQEQFQEQFRASHQTLRDEIRIYSGNSEWSNLDLSLIHI